MRTRYNWLAFFLVLTLVSAACGGGEEDTDTVATSTTQVADESPQTTVDAEEVSIATDVGVDIEAGVIRVGMLADLTGIFGPVIGLVTAGVDAFWKDVNANGRCARS